MACPVPCAVTLPFSSTVATLSSLLSHMTVLLVASSGSTTASILCLLPTVKMPSESSNVMDSITFTTVTFVSALMFSGTTSISLSTSALSFVAEVSATILVVMMQSPTPTAVTLPFSSTVATDSSLLSYVSLTSVASSGVIFASSAFVASPFSSSSRLSGADTPVGRITTLICVVELIFAVSVVTVTSASPAPTAVTKPESSTVTTLSSELLQSNVSFSASSATSAVLTSLLVLY